MGFYKEYVDPGHAAEMEVFLCLIRADLTPDGMNRISGLVESGSVDWAFLLHLVEKHRVWTVFYANIKKTGWLPLLPEDVQKSLSHQYVTVVGNNLKLCQKLLTILGLFESRHIPAVPFKGPLLAQTLYGASALRYYRDLDILVPKTCVLSARDALLESGFSPSVYGLSGKGFSQNLKHGRECHFLHPSDMVQIDLHWQLSVPYRQALDYDFCKKRLRATCFHGQDISSLSPEDTLLHLCLNGAQDIWITDVNFIDYLPTNGGTGQMSIASTTLTYTGCGASPSPASFTVGATSLSFSGMEIAGLSTGTIEVTVTVDATGTYDNDSENLFINSTIDTGDDA